MLKIDYSFNKNTKKIKFINIRLFYSFEPIISFIYTIYFFFQTLFQGRTKNRII